jgi:hypothetical protein
MGWELELSQRLGYLGVGWGMFVCQDLELWFLRKQSLALCYRENGVHEECAVV